MCDLLAVSRSGYYASFKRSQSPRQRENARLVEEIQRVHKTSRRTYGYPRIHAQLKREGFTYGRHRIARLMRENNIQAKIFKRYRRIARTKPLREVAPNRVQRNFHTPKPNRVWAADITHVGTRSGWLYLGVVIDLYSRRVVGWAMQSTMTDQLALDALKMAILNRSPKEALIHHSDQGGQYLSEIFQQTLLNHDIQCSMSRKGDCYDNAVVESFFKTLKHELIMDQRYRTREEARASVFEYIEAFYNRERLHSTLGYLSPVDYEERAYTKQVSTKPG